jgi:hypothetical protein
MSLLGINLDRVGGNFLPKRFSHEFKRGHRQSAGSAAAGIGGLAADAVCQG